jgi:hypothetical protein
VGRVAELGVVRAIITCGSTKRRPFEAAEAAAGLDEARLMLPFGLYLASSPLVNVFRGDADFLSR